MCFGSKPAPARHGAPLPVRQTSDSAHPPPGTATAALPVPKKPLPDRSVSAAASPPPPQPEGYSAIVRWHASGLGLCAGCKHHVEPLFQHYHSSPPGAPFAQRLRVFHESFAELDACAATCRTCRVFRAALALRQPDEREMATLRASGDPITAVLVQLPSGAPSPTADVSEGRGSGIGVKEPLWSRKKNPLAAWAPVTLKIALAGGAETYTRSASVALAKTSRVEYTSLARSTDGAHETLAAWLAECRAGHASCGQLGWSAEAPARLVRVLSEERVQLVEAADGHGRVPYAALSYCWGDADMSAAERASVAAGKTTAANLARRRRGFPAAELPATLRDAAALAHRAGVSHLWADTVCIVQDSAADWSRESARMHEYYGNALFTLCVASAARATAGMLGPREAWRYPASEAPLGGFRLVNAGVPLAEARAAGALAGRGWTLQEECLSPRRVYWCAQGMYWSCAEGTRAEGVPPASADVAAGRPPPVLPSGGGGADRADVSPSDFLLACWREDRARLHAEWLAVVESYARRHLAFASDRFPALSGVAARYYAHPDRYLAGLWARTFAVELAWAVEAAVEGNAELKAVAPSWSWASLPFGSRIHFRRELIPADSFALIDDTSAQEDDNDANSHVVLGAEVNSVRVSGRLLPFWTEGCRDVPWAEICRRQGGRDVFSFESVRGEDVRSANEEDGRVVVCQARRQEVVGQLDYLSDAQKAARGGMVVEALEVGKESVLLLERRADGGYRRVGVCHTSRDLFGDVEAEEIELF